MHGLVIGANHEDGIHSKTTMRSNSWNIIFHDAYTGAISPQPRWGPILSDVTDLAIMFVNVLDPAVESSVKGKRLILGQPQCRFFDEAVSDMNKSRAVMGVKGEDISVGNPPYFVFMMLTWCALPELAFMLPGWGIRFKVDAAWHKETMDLFPGDALTPERRVVTTP